MTVYLKLNSLLIAGLSNSLFVSWRGMSVAGGDGEFGIWMIFLMVRLEGILQGGSFSL